MKQILKKSLSIILALTIIFSSAYVGLNEIDFRGLFAVEAKAASSGSCGTSLTWSYDNYTLTISGSGSMTDYSSTTVPWSGYIYNIEKVVIKSGVKTIGAKAFKSLPLLSSVTLPSGLTSIGDYAFQNCRNLKSITLPSSLTSIGQYAFYDCGITTITIPSKVTSLAESVFEYCNLSSITLPSNLKSIGECALKGTNISSINIPNTVTSIGDYAFCYCEELTSITLPSKITSIGSGVFKGCYNLTSIIIPNGVTTIDSMAFYGCTKLSSITIPSTVTEIGFESFYGCNALSSVTIPSGVTAIDEGAFSECLNLKKIEVDANNAYYTSVDGVLFNKDKTTLLQYPGRKVDSAYVIPDGVTYIDRMAFDGSVNLKTLTIPQSLKSMYDYSFEECENLSAILVDENNASYASVDGVLFNKDQTVLRRYPAGKSDAEYIIPDTVTTIDKYAFLNCVNLTGITIPDSITRMGYYAFGGCSNLSSVYIFDIVAWCKIAHTDNSSYYWYDSNPLYHAEYLYINGELPTDIVIPDGVTTIPNHAFSCKNISSITIPDSVTTIGRCAFQKSSNLKYAFYPGTEEEWGNISIGSNNNPLTSAAIHYNATDHTYAEEWTTDLEPTCIDEGSKSRHCLFCDAKTDITAIEPNFHDYSTEWTVDVAPTCTEEGIKSHHCTVCDDKTDELPIPATGHSYSDWIVDIEPNCTEVGSMHKTCLYCEDVITEAIEPNGHDYSAEWTIDVEPDCTEEGSKSHHCIVCGDKTDITVVDPNGHDYSDDWTVDVEPTCTEKGSKSHHCTVCGDKTDVTEVEANGHSYGDWIIDIEPNCTEEGSKHKVCSVCGDVATEAIEPNGHDYSDEWTIDVEPDCTEEGSKSHHCIVCGDKTDITVIEPNGHNYSEDWTIDVEPTHNSLGSKSHHCVVCGDKTDITSIPALRINVDGFVYSEITEDICNITGYNKKTSTVIIPDEINGFKVKSIYQGTFKSNTDIVSVTISNGVSEIGSLAFYNCSNLKEIIIPSSVTKIASRAIYSCKDVTIKCISGSAAHTFAVGNNISFELIDITPDFGTYVDYENKYIFTDKYCTMNTIDFLFMDTVNFDATALPSQILAGKDYFGTGAQLFMFGENVDNEYTVIVKGDLNGDSVCDVLDAAVAQRYSAGFDEPTENEVYAANGCVSDEIDVISYQNVVNMALAS